MTHLKLNRRQVAALAAGAVAGLLARPALAQGKPKVVVIGGGAGGGTAARYIARDAKGAIDVTLVEPSKRYATCFYSNLSIGGFRTFESLEFGYENMAKAGVTVVHDRATGVDRSGRTVTLAGGQTLPYDRLIVAPGIDLKWDSVPGYSEAAAEAMPHAWKAGQQTQLLTARLNAVEDGQTVVMVAPPNPYRCPPGPYERASMFAHALMAKGLKNAKVVILDPKDKFSKQALFVDGWTRHYPGMVQWIGPDVHGGIKSVDPSTGEVKTDLDTFKGALVNVIPAQKAGQIAHDAGLVNETGWCPIDPFTMRSKADANVFVLGDAAIAGDMPKSAFSANSQAKVAAMTVRADLIAAKAFPARYANTCWSLIDTDDSIKIGAQYEPTAEKITAKQNFLSAIDETPEVRRRTFEESVAWYDAITADIFGA
jgi:NADPH-dependent 2,4-dienoyl-CoA reductase/sulfur reductase-like enzyme